MRITDTLLSNLLSVFPVVPPEAGGILGSDDGGKTVTHFVFDAGKPLLDCAIYMPDIPFLNEVIRDFAAQGVQFCGMVHSHPSAEDTLSKDDEAYIQQIMNAMPTYVKVLYFPLVLPGIAVIPFSIRRKNGAIMKETLEVIFSAEGGET